MNIPSHIPCERPHNQDDDPADDRDDDDGELLGVDTAGAEVAGFAARAAGLGRVPNVLPAPHVQHMQKRGTGGGVGAARRSGLFFPSATETATGDLIDVRVSPRYTVLLQVPTRAHAPPWPLGGYRSVQQDRANPKRH